MAPVTSATTVCPVGARYDIPARTLTEANFLAFQAAYGDNHPIHYDRDDCRRHGHRDLLEQSFRAPIQTAACACTLPHELGDAPIGFLEQSSRFLTLVYAGDTLWPEIVISKLKPQHTTGVMTVTCTVHNEDGVLVLEGWHIHCAEAGRGG